MSGFISKYDEILKKLDKIHKVNGDNNYKNEVNVEKIFVANPDYL